MKLKYISTVLLFLAFLPASASAQSSLYLVAEAGTIQNSMAVSGTFANLNPNNESGGTFGAAIGYRSLFAENLILGVEASIASTAGTSSVFDGFDTIAFDPNYVAGAYVTAGVAFGNDNQGLLYGMLGVGSVGGETRTFGDTVDDETIDDSGNGVSFGGAFEYGLTDMLGVRVKALHTRYTGEIDELKIRDTSIMAGLVISF